MNYQQKDEEDSERDQRIGEGIPSRHQKPFTGITISRRSVIAAAASAAVLGGLGCLKYVQASPLVRPPGGQAEDNLVTRCIRCQRCMEACPRRVIVSAPLEEGIIGVRTPALRFDASWCDFCSSEHDGVPLCVANCPTQALSLSDGIPAEKHILGLAVIDQKTCLAWRDTGCRYCYDACEYQAIELDHNPTSPRPSVITDRCNGCGACESVCVSLKAGALVEGATHRAITVVPLEAVEV